MYATFHHNIPLCLRDSTIITFSEFGARQSLDEYKISFRDLFGNILLISIIAQKFIKIFHSVKEIGPFSLFQGLALGKASADDRCYFAILWARSCQYQGVSAKFYQNIQNGLRVKFHCFKNLNLGKTSINPECHLTISWATSCQYQCVCKSLSKYSTQFQR